MNTVGQIVLVRVAICLFLYLLVFNLLILMLGTACMGSGSEMNIAEETCQAKRKEVTGARQMS